MSIMRDLGLFDEILAHTPEPGKMNLTGFRLVSGAEGHEHLFTVRPSSVFVHSVRFCSKCVDRFRGDGGSTPQGRTNTVQLFIGR